MIDALLLLIVLLVLSNLFIVYMMGARIKRLLFQIENLESINSHLRLDIYEVLEENKLLRSMKGNY